MNNQIDKTRQEVWVRAWVNVAAATNCRQSDVATTWADKCLTAYDERFPFVSEPPAAPKHVPFKRRIL